MSIRTSSNSSPDISIRTSSNSSPDMSLRTSSKILSYEEYSKKYKVIEILNDLIKADDIHI